MQCLLVLVLSLSFSFVHPTAFKLSLSYIRIFHSPQPALANILTSDTTVTNSRDFAYLIQLKIGQQPLSVIFDTGSSDLWVVSTECTTTDCNGVAKYDKTMSTSLSLTNIQPFKLSYVLGSVSGSVAFDSVSLGPFQVSNQAFALANETNGLGLVGSHSSGILGLSFPSTASISLTTGKTLLENLFSHFDESQRFFAFKLGRHPGISDPSSSFTIGHIDSDIVKDPSSITYTPVLLQGSSDYDFWKISLQSLTINSESFPLSRSLVPGASAPIAILDSGTTLILGPRVDVDAFWSKQGASVRRNAVTDMWEVRCERSILVGFTLGTKDTAKEYLVHPSDLNWVEGSSSNDGWCLGGIQANDGVNSGDWLLGATFLRNTYVIHQGAVSERPPMIGLLSLIDPDIAKTEFLNDRGPDLLPSTPPTVQVLTQALKQAPRPTAAVCVLSGLLGFIVGGLGVGFFRWRKSGRFKKTSTMIS